jgi:hypothetical protein
MEGGPMMQLLDAFVLMVLLVSSLQVAFLSWLLWPSIRVGTRRLHYFLWQKTHCAWCWKAWHLRHWMPRQWTSCLCQRHYQAEKKRLLARRTARLVARSTTPPLSAAALQVEQGERPVLEEVAI